MALLYDSVREINPMKEKWSIKIKVIRLWTTPDFIILKTITALKWFLLMKRSLLLKFGPILHEGSVYSISRFGVGQPSGDYRPTKHAYKINFLSTTIVEQLNELDMPISAYKFVCFRDILSNKLDDKYLVDVIGGVTEVSKLEITERNGKMNKRLEIELEDLDGEKSSSSILTRVDSYSTHTTEDEFLQSSIKKRIDDIRETQEVSTCVTLATIICIESSHGWWYKACKKDLKKIKEVDVEGKKRLWCDKCNAYVDDVNARFKLQIRVVDETGNASFVLFDREVAQIIGKSADQLRESCHSKIDDEDSIPDELNKIVDKKYLFKIKISEYNLQQRWPVYTVTKMTADERLIKLFIGATNVSNDQEEVGESSKFGEFSLFTKEKYMVEQRKNDDDDNSEICSNSFSTPNHKRVFQDLQDTNIEEDITPAELSTSKSRKVIVVKKEKDETEF
ncbi:Replication protein A 70 kDa DNA-binding subunit B [Bienertia sinuspersici]